jgi:hypothetical protein
LAALLLGPLGQSTNTKGHVSESDSSPRILKIGFEYIHLTSILKTNTNTDIHINVFSG